MLDMKIVIPQPLKLFAWYGTQKISDIRILSSPEPEKKFGASPDNIRQIILLLMNILVFFFLIFDFKNIFFKITYVLKR